MTGEAAAEASHGSDQNQAYNIQAGPFNLSASAGGTVAFNDNINIAHNGREADIILTPSANVSGVWQMTELNALTFNVGLGYQAYCFHPENSGIVISPSSQTSFNVFIGDVKLNFHDRFSYTQDPIDIGQLSNVAQFPVFSNTAGVGLTWDIGDVVTTLGYDHSNQWVFASAYNYLNYQSNILSGTVGVNLSREIQVGVESTGTFTSYQSNIMNDSTGASAGAYVTAQVSDYLAVNGHAGWTYGDFANGGLVGDNSNLGSFYASLGVNHRINDVLSESFTAGHDFLPGINSNYTQQIFANYNLNWKTTDYLNTSLGLWWENLADSSSINAQNSNRYGINLSETYSLNEHASLSAGYNFTLKDCNNNQFSYYQDVLTLGFSYKF